MLPFDVLKLWIELVQRFLMSSSELELVIGLAQGLTGMLISYAIPWNWNWVLDWVSVHRACSSSLI